jgi:hypothetical protein
LIAHAVGAVRAEKDEIFIQEILEFRIAVKLLAQQDTAPSARAEKIEQDDLAFALSFCHGLIECPFEPVLG